MQNSFGLVALLGSGETSLAGGRVFESIAGQYSRPVRIAVLETPAGFELNSQKVAGRVAEFLKARLHEYSPQIDIVPARKRGTSLSPDELSILKPLCELLPSGHTTLGLDEHTGVIFDLAAGKCSVNGAGSVTLLRARNPAIFMAGTEFAISELGEFRRPVDPKAGISNKAWNLVKNAVQANGVQDMEIPAEVSRLAEARLRARDCQDWAEADILRRQMAALGWIAQDTTEGQKLVRQS